MSSDVPRTALGAICPHCLRRLRVPADRLADRPRCPACKASILPGTPIELDDRSFDAFLGGSDLPVLVDFWAPWCGPCRTFAPILAAAAREFTPQLLVAKVNADAAIAAASRTGIRSIPTLVLYRGGREVARQSGALAPTALRQWLATVGMTN